MNDTKIRPLLVAVKGYNVSTAKKTGDPHVARGRPREFDAEQALETALLMFWKHGYEGTSLASLTKAMGINVPSLYAAFGNKESLFRLAVERYLSRPASYLPKALEAPTAREVVARLFQGAIDMVMNPRHPDGCLLVQGALVSGPLAEPIKDELKKKRHGAEILIRCRFEQAQAAGDLPADVNPEHLARYITTVLWGMSVQAAGGATREQLNQVADMVLRCWPAALSGKEA